MLSDSAGRWDWYARARTRPFILFTTLEHLPKVNERVFAAVIPWPNDRWLSCFGKAPPSRGEEAPFYLFHELINSDTAMEINNALRTIEAVMGLDPLQGFLFMYQAFIGEVDWLRSQRGIGSILAEFAASEPSSDSMATAEQAVHPRDPRPRYRLESLLQMWRRSSSRWLRIRSGPSVDSLGQAEYRTIPPVWRSIELIRKNDRFRNERIPILVNPLYARASQSLVSFFEETMRAGGVLNFSPRTHTPGPQPANEISRFHRDGETWTLSFQGMTVSVAHCKGMTDIAQLLRNPDTPVSAITLMTGDLSSPAEPSEYRTMSKEQLEESGMHISRGQSGLYDPVDKQWVDKLEGARKEVLTKLRRAKEMRDNAEVHCLSKSLRLLDKPLKEARGFGGGSRLQKSDADRASDAVRKRIRFALGRIQEKHFILAQHLDSSIKRGSELIYSPVQLVNWTF